jgi:hypothetical protein
MIQQRPTSARQEQVNQYIRSWLHFLEDCNQNSLCPTLRPAQIRELYRATSSRAARKAIKLCYKLNAAQWAVLFEDGKTYIMNQNDAPLTVEQLDILDIRANSRTARALLRRRGPADNMFNRTLQRQLAAHMNDTFGPTLRRLRSCSAKRRTKGAMHGWRREHSRPCASTATARCTAF